MLSLTQTDRMIYFVECDFRQNGRAFVERDSADMDRRTTIRDIAEGQFRGEVVTVLECNPVENICNDVTEEILNAASRFDTAADTRRGFERAV